MIESIKLKFTTTEENYTNMVNNSGLDYTVYVYKGCEHILIDNKNKSKAYMCNPQTPIELYRFIEAICKIDSKERKDFLQTAEYTSKIASYTNILVVYDELIYVTATSSPNGNILVVGLQCICQSLAKMTSNDAGLFLKSAYKYYNNLNFYGRASKIYPFDTKRFISRIKFNKKEYMLVDGYYAYDTKNNSIYKSNTEQYEQLKTKLSIITGV